MKVLYDYQAFMQHHGGVSRYFVEVTRAMSELDGFQAILPSPYCDNIYLENGKRFLTNRPFKGKVRIMTVLNRRKALRSLKADFDLFHPTYYRPYFLESLRTPFVVTVHDMIHERFGGEHVRDDGSARDKRILCERAARIIAVSQSTKDDLCRILGVPEEKVHVIHHATNMRYCGQARPHGRGYILHVGERAGYKNFTSLLEAFGLLAAERDVDLVCVGGRGFSGAENDAIRSLRLDGRVFHRAAASSEDLAAYYHWASVFCFPSLCEGFGIPLIEAFSCGCPTAASDIPAFREVAQAAVEYFDPRDPGSIAGVLRKIMDEPSYSSRLVEAGKTRLKDFSWKRSAEQTMEVYRNAIA